MTIADTSVIAQERPRRAGQRPGRRPGHRRDHPECPGRGRRRDERQPGPQRLHADHLRGQGLQRRAVRRGLPAARPGARPADLPRRARRRHPGHAAALSPGSDGSRRRLPGQRLLPGWQPPERHLAVQPRVSRRLADRVRRHQGALDRHRVQGSEPDDELHQYLPGGLPDRPDPDHAPGPPERRSPRHLHDQQSDAAQHPRGLLRDGGRVPDRRTAAAGPARPLCQGRHRRCGHRDLPAVRARGPGVYRQPARRPLGRRGVHGLRRQRQRPGAGEARGDDLRLGDPPRPGRLRQPDRRLSQLRLRPDGVRGPARVQVPGQSRYVRLPAARSAACA